MIRRGNRWKPASWLHIDWMDCETWTACAVSASGTSQGRPMAIDAIIQAKGAKAGSDTALSARAVTRCCRP